MSALLRRATSFLAELKRRRVYRVGVVYAAVAFILLQAVDLVSEPLGLPGLVMTVLVVTALFGFPLALVLAWAFEVTPEGVRKTVARPVAPEGAPDPEHQAAGSAHGPNRGVGGAAVLLGVGMLLAGGIGWWLLGPAGTGDADPLGIRSVAVLPLDNFSGEPDQQPFVAGMHEELINQLSQVGALMVKSRTSVMRYEPGNLRSIGEIGAELGVDAVLQGSVLRVDDQVRITVQLIHVPTDTHLWSGSFDRELRDVLALHSDVARAVAQQVHAVLTPDESRRLASTREVDPRALDHYVRARYLWNQRQPDALREALSEFQAALDVDPTYAQAWAGIADTYAVPAGMRLAEDGRARAIEAARRALALDSTLAEAHTALAYGLMGDWAWDEAEHHFRRAIALNPSYATAHQWYAELLVAQNRMEEAVASSRRATERDPLSEIIAWSLARTLYFARQPRAALEQLRRIPDRPEGRPDPYVGVLAHLQLGQVDSAWTRILAQSAFSGELQEELQGRREEGMHPVTAMHSLLEEGLPADAAPGGLGPPPDPLIRIWALSAAVAGGRVEDSVFDSMENALASGQIGVFVVDLVADPSFDSIRNDPRYRAFLQKVGLAEYWLAR